MISNCILFLERRIIGKEKKRVNYLTMKIPLSPDTRTRNGYLWLYEDKLPRINTYGIELLVFYTV